MMKNILITGAEVADVGTGNRGAEHLLRTTTKRVASMGYSPAVSVSKVDPRLLSELALKQYVGNPRARLLDRITPPIDYRGILTINALHGVLDASGFALGDAWGVHTATWLERKYDQWKSRGLKIVLLPQAFGPFTDPALRVVAESAFSHCELIFAREKPSYENLIELGVPESKCRISPDITVGETNHSTSGFRTERTQRFVLVPNWNLAERGGGSAYVDTLVDATNWAKDNGLEAVGLLHEGAKDLDILRQVNGKTSLTLHDELSGWATKEFISQSALVLSGRYHGVLAALMTSTPVITHSWSHKYREVLIQFGVEDWLRDPTDSQSTLGGLEDALRFGVPDELSLRRAELATQVDSMWHEVGEVFA